MRKTKRVMLLAFVIMISVMSCNNEELFVEPVGQEITDDTEDEQVEEDEDEVVDASLPCDFNLNNLKPNSTIIINCILDLNGESIDLPTNVTIEYSGGDIINGTLNFSDNSVIDGNLLNSTLTLSGSNPQLKDPVFVFSPSRWGIVEGEVMQPVAFNNHIVLQSAVDKLKEIGITIFSIDKMDAYFDSVEINTPILELPSDFHLKMSESTHLRVFPVDKVFSSWMIRIRNKSNVTISGGFIHGERDEHGPTIPKSGALVWIMSGKDILVENVHMSKASMTGLTINSYRFSDHPEYDPSKNVIIRGCIFDSNRANNLSITDGEDIIVEACQLFRAGIDTPYSLGTAPKVGIVIEPVGGQKVDGVILRNNILKEGGGKSAILAALGNDILITGNEADLPVGWTLASNVRVINNPALRGGVSGGDNSTYGLSQSRDNEISGNTIIGAPTGIQSTADDVKIFNNKLIDCKVSMMLRELEDSEIYNNTITNDVEGSFGLNAQGYLNNVTIRDNVFNLSDGRPISMSGINSDPEYSNYHFIIKDNTFDCGNNGTITRTSGIDIMGNNFLTSGLTITDSNSIEFKNNSVKSNSFCLKIGKNTTTKDITITGNVFESTNSEKLGGYGIRMSSSGGEVITENTNILVQDNTVKVLGSNYGIHVKDLDGVTINNNEGSSETYEFIYFRGNNSTITDNRILSGPDQIDVIGSNNTIANNN